MEITVSRLQGKVSVTVVQPHGKIDSSNYTDLVNEVQRLMEGGAQDFVIDLSDVPFMSSAGLAGLHRLTVLLRGEVPSAPASGSAASKSADGGRVSGFQKHIRLLNPQESVAEILDTAGFTELFEIFTDLQKAAASF